MRRRNRVKVGEAVWVFEPNTSLLQRLQATFGKGSCLFVGRQLFVLEPWQFLFCKTYMAICTIYCLHDKLVCVSLMCIQYYVALFRSSSSYLCLCHSCIRICTTSFFVSNRSHFGSRQLGALPHIALGCAYSAIAQTQSARRLFVLVSSSQSWRASLPPFGLCVISGAKLQWHRCSRT